MHETGVFAPRLLHLIILNYLTLDMYETFNSIVYACCLPNHPLSALGPPPSSRQKNSSLTHTYTQKGSGLCRRGLKMLMAWLTVYFFSPTPTPPHPGPPSPSTLPHLLPLKGAVKPPPLLFLLLLPKPLHHSSTGKRQIPTSPLSACRVAVDMSPTPNCVNDRSRRRCWCRVVRCCCCCCAVDTHESLYRI